MNQVCKNVFAQLGQKQCCERTRNMNMWFGFNEDVLASLINKSGDEEAFKFTDCNKIRGTSPQEFDGVNSD